MIEEIKYKLGISTIPAEVDMKKLEEYWSKEHTKIYAFRYVAQFVSKELN